MSVLESMPMQRETIIDALSAYFARQADVVVAYLFGSQAAGTARPTSDFDLAVLVEFQPAMDALSQFERRLSLLDDVQTLLNRETDLVLLNTAPSLLRHQVINHGIVLFQRDLESRIDFEVLTEKFYYDDKRVQEYFDQVLQLEVKEGRLGRRQRDY